jgi:antiviral helicase SKI2
MPKTLSANNSTSLDRAPSQGGAKGRDFVRGKSGNVPFWPGGLEAPEMQKNSKMTDDEFLGLVGKLKTVPPGFKKGLRFKGDDEGEEDELDLTEGDELPSKEVCGSSIQAVPISLRADDT